MGRLTLEQKALRVIDFLVSGDMGVTMCCKSAFNREFTQEDAKVMADAITQIYTIAHSAVPDHSCFEVHDDWRKETLSLFRKFKKAR
ncbi:hypothetical protein LCGC14_1014130 [marine sediment metagenome]|uniref:Uncharacterized protein n=1 Tax=marine sediment metagenome TaxID=412755 RepID=A0A0F9R5D8_9ZZZZ